MKKVIQKLKNKKNKIINRISILGSTFCSTAIIMQAKVYAASNTESIDSFIAFACDWLTKIGEFIALVGRSYVCFRLAKRRYAEGKSRGLMTLMAGFMLVAIAQTKNLFGL